MHFYLSHPSHCVFLTRLLLFCQNCGEQEDDEEDIQLEIDGEGSGSDR